MESLQEEDRKWKDEERRSFLESFPEFRSTIGTLRACPVPGKTLIESQKIFDDLVQYTPFSIENEDGKLRFFMRSMINDDEYECDDGQDPVMWHRYSEELEREFKQDYLDRMTAKKDAIEAKIAEYNDIYSGWQESIENKPTEDLETVYLKIDHLKWILSQYQEMIESEMRSGETYFEPLQNRT